MYRILVTGGHGFLGTHLCKQLLDLGHEVDIPNRKEFDLIYPYCVQNVYKKFRPEIVIHLAAKVGGIGANMEHPGSFFYENMMMGMNLIHAAKNHSTIKKFIQVGTVCSYPKFTQVPFKEVDIWKGYPEETNAPYGIAKKALLVMLEGYYKEYGLNYNYLIPVNLYGPGDEFNPNKSHVIPALILKFHEAIENNAKEVVIWGTGVVSREFLYVGDCAHAISLAVENCDNRQPINLGTGNEITIEHLVNKIASIMNYKGDIIWDISKPDGQPRRCLDTSRALQNFDFEATVDFDSGLTQTIEWFKNEYITV